MQDRVYHWWSRWWISSFIPQTSTHGEKRVYAVRSPEVAVCFIPRSSDIDFHIGRYDWEFQIIERWKWAFEKYYIWKKWYLYTLPWDSFISNQTSWVEEIVSDQIVYPLEEIVIEDIYSYLQWYIKPWIFAIMDADNQPEWLSVLDNNDIVDKVATRSIQFDKQDYYLSCIREAMPFLEQRVIHRIQSMRGI